ncbi:hypothetical protein [Nostoc sp. NOS(2021)]|uniref:hypothetical protein n=1 Tax=Nostoc sp. NOS(2021) TaxID=2815407 RepID=UPI0025E105B9|nr:hypothetical protein [Nostoc sp. NOS(2021)]
MLSIFLRSLNSSLSGLTQKLLKSLIYRTAFALRVSEGEDAFSARGFANAQRLVEKSAENS